MVFWYLWISIIFVNLCITSSYESLSAKFSLLGNFRITGPWSPILTANIDKLQCIFECHEQDECIGFNYENTASECELIPLTSLEPVVSTKTYSDTWKYFTKEKFEKQTVNLNFKCICDAAYTDPLTNDCPKPHLCQQPTVDSIAFFPDGRSYTFKGQQVYRLDGSARISAGYPHLISNDFPGLPSCINAAFTWENEVYVFKGSLYWKLTNYKLACCFPQPISKNFYGIPNDLDAAFIYKKNNHAHFFKGNQHWAYQFWNPNFTLESKSYPRSMNDWYGIPHDIQSAVSILNGKTYFISGTHYYQWDNGAHSRDGGYPKPNGPAWFGC